MLAAHAHQLIGHLREDDHIREKMMGQGAKIHGQRLWEIAADLLELPKEITDSCATCVALLPDGIHECAALKTNG